MQGDWLCCGKILVLTIQTPETLVGFYTQDKYGLFFFLNFFSLSNFIYYLNLIVISILFLLTIIFWISITEDCEN